MTTLEPDGYSEVKRRYRVPAGRILVARDKVVTRDGFLFDEGSQLIVGSQEKASIAQMFEQWSTVLLIGDPYVTEYGVTKQPPDGLVEGSRILMAPTGGRDVTLKFGEASMEITIIPFETVMLIDSGEAEALDVQ